MPDNRDEYRKKTPPAGVRAQLAPTKPNREDPTPIGAPPSLLVPERAAASRATVGDLDVLRKDVEGKLGGLAQQHQEIRNEVAGVKSDVSKVNAAQAQLMLETSKQSLSLDALVRKANLDEVEQRALDLEKKKLELRDGAHAKKKTRDFVWYVVRGVLAIGFAAATTGLTLLLEHGC